MGRLSLLQWIFLTKEWNWGLLHCRQILYQLTYQGSLRVLLAGNYMASPRGGNGNPLQCSSLENPVDRRAWWAAVDGVAQSQTWLKQLSMHPCIGEGNGNPLQCSCLENPRDRGAWWAAVYGVTESRTRLKWLSSSSSIWLHHTHHELHFLNLFEKLLIYFWPLWIFVAAHGLSLVAAGRGYSVVAVCGLLPVVASCCRAQALGSRAPVLQHIGSVAVALGL